MTPVDVAAAVVVEEDAAVEDAAVVMTAFWQILVAAFLHFLCSSHQNLFYSNSVDSMNIKFFINPIHQHPSLFFYSILFSF